MSIFNTLNVGASGLGVSGAQLSVIGNNIANLGTTGYKSSRASFADLLPQQMGGLGGGGQLGRGAGLNVIENSFEQGTLVNTGSALDLAINGQGFFEVKDQEGATYYTRDGSFYMDKDGYIVNAMGLKVQGYQATDFQIGGGIGDIQITTRLIKPEPTTEVVIQAILDHAADGSSTPIEDALAAGGATIEDLNGLGADASTSFTIYDALGVAHEVTVYFEQDDAAVSGGATKAWNWYAVVDAGETGGTAGEAQVIAEGNLQFSGDGDLIESTQAAATGWTFNDAAAQDIFFDFGLEGTTPTTGGGYLTNTGPTSMNSIAQNGSPVGELLSLTVNEAGEVIGNYSNGEQRDIGQIALAIFTDNNGLEMAGSNLFKATRASGEAALGAGGFGSRGAIANYALEGSNVDMEAEFITMITAQRSYQANARVINTANETLQELVNLV